MCTCPHCNKPGVSLLRKLCLGPAMPATCKECGRKVGVPYSSMLAFIPFGVAIILVQIVDSTTLQMGIWVVGFLLYAVIHMKFVPLVRK